MLHSWHKNALQAHISDHFRVSPLSFHMALTLIVDNVADLIQQSFVLNEAVNTVQNQLILDCWLQIILLELQAINNGDDDKIVMKLIIKMHLINL